LKLLAAAALVVCALPLVAQGRPPFRVLFSNDTTNISNCPSPFNPKTGPFRESYLRAEVVEAARGGADAQFLQPGLGWVPWWQSKVLPMAEHAAWLEARGRSLNGYEKFVLGGGDLIAVFVDECRKQGVAPFVSLRMNDVHHIYRGVMEKDPVKQRTAMEEFRFFADHPGYLLGPGADRDERMQYAMDFGRSEVLDFKLRLIAEICANYDIDGLELDFMRHWALFHLARTTPEERRKIMVNLLTEVRTLLDRSAKPGKRRWLCVRIPGYRALFDGMGIDLREWAAAGVDMFNVSGHYFTDFQTDLPAIIEGTPPSAAVYAEMHFTSAARPGNGATLNRRTTDQQFYTAAHVAYARGAAGVSLFNFHYYRGTKNASDVSGEAAEPPFSIFAHLAEPAWLARQPQEYVIAYLLRPSPAKRAFSGPIPPGGTVEFALDMAPPEGGWIRSGKLRIQGVQSLENSEWEIAINGRILKSAPDVAGLFTNPYRVALGGPADYRAWEVPADAVRNGTNRITITLKNAAEPHRLFYLDLAMP
jgi:hypothetical protein